MSNLLGQIICISCCVFHTLKLNFVFSLCCITKKGISRFKMRTRSVILLCCAIKKTLLYIVSNTQYEVSFFRVQTLESSDVDACGKVRDFSNNMSHSCAHYCIWAILSWVLQRKAEKRQTKDISAECGIYLQFQKTFLAQNHPFYSTTCLQHKSQHNNKLAHSKASQWFQIQISIFPAILGWILGNHSQNRFIVLSLFLRFRHLSEPFLLYLS